MTTLFVADLHLSGERPDKLELFLAFADRARHTAQAVYVLGDLFEVWLGDDDDSAPHPRIVAALRALSASGVRLHIAHGNRDFLVGERFAQATGATLLSDYETIDLHGTRALLTHGDLLCTRDVKYQRFRRVVRHPLTRAAFLAAPLAWRRHIARKTQSGTRASMRLKPEHIMDVDDATVARVMSRYGVDLLIHGHTHRPAVHDHAIDGRACRRIVLGDWYEQDGVLVCDRNGQQAMRVHEFLA